MKRFKKGQKIYKASTYFGEVYGKENKISIMTVIERTVDACGKKQMTFFSHGFDSIFGKSVQMKYATEYFETREEAYNYLEQYKTEHDKPGYIHEIMIGEYTDQDRTVFDDYDRVYKK